MRPSGRMYESNSESEGAEMFRPRKTVNEPPSPDLRRRSRQRAPSREGSRNNTKMDDMKSMSSDKENTVNGQLQDRQRKELWERQNKNLSMRSAGGQEVPGSRRTRPHATSTLETYSSAESESFLGHRLRIPSSTAGDSGRNSNQVMIKQEVEETPPKRHSSRQLIRSSSRASPNQAATNSSAAKKLSNFKAAEKAGRTICVCGASAYYERERFALLKEKGKLKEDQQALREESKRVMENHRKVKEEIFECEKKRNELESCSRSLQRNREMQQEEAAVLEQSRRQLQKLKDQIDKDKDALQRTQQDLILKGEELASRKAHLERLQQDLKSKKAELEERSIQIKKQAIKNESVEATLEMESHKLATMQSELALESEQLKQREATLRENEGRYEEKRRMLQSLESRLNHEVAMNEEKVKYLEEKESDLQRRVAELDVRESELKKSEQELERQKQELSIAKSEFEFQRQRELESIENEKKAAAVEIQLSKEDCAAFIELEKEWISQEKENLAKHKDSVQVELEAEREHTQQMMVQMRKRNHEAIAEEKEEWRREQQRITETRNRQRLELESMRESLSQKEYELLTLKEALASEREQLDQEKAALEAFKDIEMKKIQAEKTESLKQGQQIRKDRQNCAQIEAQLKARLSALDAREEALNAREREMQQQWQNLSRLEGQWETRKKELEAKAKQLAALQQELNDEKETLVAREKRLTNSEAQASWLKEIYAELKEKKEAIAAQEKRLEMEKLAIFEQRQSLLLQQQQTHQIRGTPSQGARLQQRATPKRFPGTLCRRYSTSGLPQIQTVLPPHSRLASFGPIITVSSSDEGSKMNSDVRDQNIRQVQTPNGQVLRHHTEPPGGEAYEGDKLMSHPAAEDAMRADAADWGMFAAFDDASDDDFAERDRTLEFMQPSLNRDTETASGHEESKFLPVPPSQDLKTLCDKDTNRSKRMDSGGEDNDDASLSSRENLLLKQFGGLSPYERMNLESTISFENYDFGVQRASESPEMRQSSPALSSYRSRASHHGSDHSKVSHKDELTKNQSGQPSHRDSARQDDKSEKYETEIADALGYGKDDEGSMKNQAQSQVSAGVCFESSGSQAKSFAEDHTFIQEQSSPVSQQQGALNGDENEDVTHRRVQTSCRINAEDGHCSYRSRQLASSRGSSPLMCPELRSAETPQHNDSCEMPMDPSLSAPTTSPAYVGRNDLSLHLTSIDFDTSIGPTISSALLVNCTEEVRESIEHTIQMTYGSSHRSWQAEQDAYKSINKSLDMLSSEIECREVAVHKGPTSISATTSERTTTGAHENDGPSNSSWEIA